MKIKAIRIDNFRSFDAEELSLNSYTCLVGPNGAGKSNVLAALNVFFQEKSATSDVGKLIDEDYFDKRTGSPIRITVTFGDLNNAAQSELAAYARNGEVVVSAEAEFNTGTGVGLVRHFGQRLGLEKFRHFFEAEKAGAKVSELNPIYLALREEFTDLPAASSKDAKVEALREYESSHPDLCVLIPSEDDFYGVNSTGKLARFVQWVFVPAVKDAGEEGLEARNTAFGKLIARAVRTRVNFDQEIDALKAETLAKYKELVERNRESHNDLSNSLRARLEAWAHPDVKLGLEWLTDPGRSVAIQAPVAGIKTGDADFQGSLARMGHGLQRSYLLALLQELAAAEAENAPTLLLGCEEPELYQHPPQARHLSEVLEELSRGNNQVIVTTHSPYFVSGDGFENVRLVRKSNGGLGSKARGLRFQDLCSRIRTVRGEDLRRPTDGLVAKIHQALQPSLTEMFFAKVPILVEGLEDVSYITTSLHQLKLWGEFRRLGCHLVAVQGKSRLLQPKALAIELGLPAYVVFDADGGETNPGRRTMHENDNRHLIALLNAGLPDFPPADVIGADYAVWKDDLGSSVKADLAENYERLANAARAHYQQERDLEKIDLFIAEWLSAAHAEGLRSPTLENLCKSILSFARAA